MLTEFYAVCTRCVRLRPLVFGTKVKRDDWVREHESLHGPGTVRTPAKLDRTPAEIALKVRAQGRE